MLLCMYARAYTPLVIEDNEDYFEESDIDSKGVPEGYYSHDLHSQTSIQSNGNTFWPKWAYQYKDTAAMTGFSNMVLHSNIHNVIEKTTNKKSTVGCEDNFVLVTLPLGPICVAKSEFLKTCINDCELPSICWNGSCIDPTENMCYKNNKFVACR